MNTPSSPTPRKSGKVMAGTLLLLVGTVLLLQRLGYLFPHWLFSWPVLLIVIGLFIGFRHNFRNPGWFILITIGSIFLAEDLVPDLNAGNFLWPVLIILLGLWMIFGRNRHSHYPYSRFSGNNPDHNLTENPVQADAPSQFYTGNVDSENHQAGVYSRQPLLSGENMVNITAVLGGVKRIIVSKNFQGGEITTFMGGTELNLTQADIQGQAVLDITQVMGGTRLTVPSHWNVVSEVVSIFGGIDDKRILQPTAFNSDKVLIIKGTSFMGGVDIRSY